MARLCKVQEGRAGWVFRLMTERQSFLGDLTVLEYDFRQGPPPIEMRNGEKMSTGSGNLRRVRRGNPGVRPIRTRIS
jgi:hypothetical protein